MLYDYSKLLGRIKERGFTQEMLASAVGIQPPTLSQKLGNKAKFKQGEISAICKVLNIADADIGLYFFTHLV